LFYCEAALIIIGCNKEQQIINTMHTEGNTAKAIEHQTAKLPSTLFLGAAMASMGVSLALKCLGQKHTALFVGQWAAPFLLLGLYNKIVKVEGSDFTEKAHLSAAAEGTAAPRARFEHDANASANEPKPVQMNDERTKGTQVSKDDQE
jgi:hypothetical protein